MSLRGDGVPHRDSGLIRGVRDHNISEDHGAVSGEEDELVVVRPQRGFTLGDRRNDLVPGALDFVAVNERVFREHGIIEPDRERRLSGVASSELDHGGKCDRARQRKLEMTIAASRTRKDESAGRLFKRPVTGDLGDLGANGPAAFDGGHELSSLST